ncbi:MAG: transposase [Syntrophaceae bacterium]|nr:transposase [Syntrophaceae bacterium]
MTRPLRIQYQNAWYHVMNRGRRGESIYHDAQDYQQFMDLLRETNAMWNIKIGAYCLMNNHYHLLLQTPQANLDRCMRHVNGLYTQRFNRRHHVDGQLFRGRYKAILIDVDSYLLEVVRYIHRNPMRAGIVKYPQNYRWSSYREYIQEAAGGQYLNRNFILEMLDHDRERQIKAFIDFMKQEDSEEIQSFYAKKNMSSFLGTDKFVEKIKTLYFGIKKHREIPQARNLEPTIKDIKQIVNRVYKVKPDSMLKLQRGFNNEPRDVAIYLVRNHTGKKLEEIGKEFNIDKYSTVSSIIVKIRDQKKVEGTLAKKISQIEGIINGQRQT